MNGEDVPEHSDSRTKKKQIQRSKAVSDLQSKLPSGEKPPSCANLDELKSRETGNQCGSVTKLLTEQKNLTLQISVSTVGDEGYDSRRPSDVSTSDAISILSSCPSRSSINSTSSTSNIPPTILEDDENSKPITFDCQRDSDSKDRPFPQNEESETLITKLTLLELADTDPHGRESLQTQSANLPPRRHSYQHLCPHSSQRICHRRSSEATLLTGGRPTVITIKMLPSRSEERPTGRRNSQQLASRPAPKQNLPSTRSYIFKATPIRRYNSEIFTALYDEDDPDCPYRKVRVAMSKLRRMSITISEFAKDALKASCMNEELTELELWDIADRLGSKILHRLATNLSFSTVEYQRMKIEEPDLAYMILYKWRENHPEGPQNRKELAGILFDLNERNLADMVASKKYTRPSGTHSLSWEMVTATTNTSSDSDIAVKCE